MSYYYIVFFIFAILLVILAFMVISSRRLIHSSIYLLIFLILLSGLFISLGLSFVGSVELLVYAGAIVTLLVFTLMLTGGEDVEE